MAVDPKPRRSTRPAKKAAGAPKARKAGASPRSRTAVAERPMPELLERRQAFVPELTDKDSSLDVELTDDEIADAVTDLVDEGPIEDVTQTAAPMAYALGSDDEIPSGIRGIIAAYKPKTLTGGLPAMPLLLILAISVMDEFDKQMVGILTPEIKDYFGLDVSSVLGLSALAGIIGVCAAIPIGYLVDRVNRTWLTAIGMFVLAAFSVFSAFSPVLWMFALARFGSSMGKSFEATQFSLLSDLYPPHTRGGIFASKELVRRVALIIAPLLAGLLATVLFFQAAFIAVAIPSAILGFLALKYIREPVRGEQERRAMGADEATSMRKDPPPSMAEGIRIAWNVRSFRRLLYALPLLVGPGGGIAGLLSLYYQDEFNLGPAARGFIGAINEPFGIAGVLIGGAVASRFMRYRPGRVVTYGGLMAALSGLSFIGIALVPNLALAVGFACISTFAMSILAPSISALASLTVPARARGIAGALIATFVVPGLVVIFFAGELADRYGYRGGIIAMAPIFILGAFVLSSSGLSVDADIRAAMAAAMAAEESRKAVEAGQAKLLVVRDLDLHYDQVQILFNVDFDVEEGEIIALLGTNGAGKSTLLRAISGLTAPSNGAIFYDGHDITYLPSNEHAARGIIQTPGGRGVFPSLTVAENLKIAGWMFRKDEGYVNDATNIVLDYFPRLRERLDQPAGNLSGGEQQMLTLSQAFLSRPRLLMIDELSLGLAPAIVEQLLVIVRAIADLGTTIILVEQSVNVALTVANKAVFMEKGEVKFAGPTEDLMRRPDILRSVYLKGSGGGGIIPSGKANRVLGDAPVETALELKGIRKSWGGVHAINGVDFRVPEGQILGLIGPNGAGKTTIFDIISGFVEPDEGQVLIYEEDATFLTPDNRSKLGLQRSFQDARLFPALTVSENIAVALERHVEARSTTMAALHLPNVGKSEAKLLRRVERLIELLNLGDFRDKFVRELSTGSRRIVDLACVMAADPRVLLLDEPSSGIAQKEAEELGPLLQRIKFETGATMLIIEHDMPLIMSVSDELLALEVGTVVTRGLPQDVIEHPQVVASYLGNNENVINRSGNA